MNDMNLNELIEELQYKRKKVPDPYNRFECLFSSVCPFGSDDPKSMKEFHPRYYGREDKCFYIMGYKCPFNDKFPDKRKYTVDYPYPLFDMDDLFNIAFRRQIRSMNEDMSRLPVRPGVFFPQNHAQMLYNGQKKVMIKTQRFNKFNNYPIYWFDEQYVYGMVRLGNPYGPINRQQAHQLSQLSGITPEELNRWYPSGEQFWFWKLMVTIRFKQPVKHPPWSGIQIFKRQIVLEDDDIEWDIE